MSSPAIKNEAVSPVGIKPPWVAPLMPPNSVNPLFKVSFLLKKYLKLWA